MNDFCWNLSDIKEEIERGEKDKRIRLDCCYVLVQVLSFLEVDEVVYIIGLVRVRVRYI